MRKILWAAWFAMVLLPGMALAKEIAGVSVPEILRNNDATLVLNGAGVRSKFFIKVYVGALYLARREAQAAKILAADDPWSVQMHFLHSEVEAKKLTDAWNDGFDANLAAMDRQRLADKINSFNALFRTVRRGDVIRIDYAPANGLRVSIQDEPRGSVAGADFARAVLSIWLGDKPADTELKRAMLGTD